MMSEKDKISLIMECNNPPSSKLRMLWEKRCQKPAYSNSYFGIKVVQDQLWNMFCCNSMVFDVFLILNTCYLKNCKHSLKMASKQFPSIRISQNHYVCKVKVFSILIHLLKLHVSSWVKGYIVKDHHNFFEEIINFYWRLELSGDKYLDWRIIFKNIIEFIEHCFIILLNKLFSALLLVFNGYWLLSQFFRQFLSLFPFLNLYLTFDQASLEMNFHSFLFIFNLIRLLFESSCKLKHALWFLSHWFAFLFSYSKLLLVRFGLICLFDHC